MISIIVVIIVIVIVIIKYGYLVNIIIAMAQVSKAPQGNERGATGSEMPPAY